MSQNFRNTANLRNKYNEILKQCRETRGAAIITLNGLEDTSYLKIRDYKQNRSELELLRTLLEADDDVQNLRVSSMKNL